MPLALLSDAPQTFFGSERLMSRPLDVYEKLCADSGLTFNRTGRRVTVKGRLRPGEYTVDGSVSSQFITGLLFALSVFPSDSVIHVKPPFASRSYVVMTAGTMERFGVRVIFSGDDIIIPGGQTYDASVVRAEGDHSAAAFPYALNFLGGSV